MVQKDEGLGLSIWNIFGASTSHNSNAQLLVVFIKKKIKGPLSYLLQVCNNHSQQTVPELKV